MTAGNVIEALRSYEDYRELLWRELEVEPSDPMHRLIEPVKPRGAVPVACRARGGSPRLLTAARRIGDVGETRARHPYLDAADRSPPGRRRRSRSDGEP